MEAAYALCWEMRVMNAPQLRWRATADLVGTPQAPAGTERQGAIIALLTVE
jgi:hypothetical protein